MKLVCEPYVGVGVGGVVMRLLPRGEVCSVCCVSVLNVGASGRCKNQTYYIL